MYEQIDRMGVTVSYLLRYISMLHEGYFEFPLWLLSLAAINANRERALLAVEFAMFFARFFIVFGVALGTNTFCLLCPLSFRRGLSFLAKTTMLLSRTVAPS